MNTKIFPHVKLPDSVEIGMYCIIGEPFRGMDAGNAQTIIGPDALIRSHTVIYAGNSIGANFQTGHHVFIRELNQIGNNVSVGTLSVVEHHVVIGNNVRLHTQVFIPEFSIIEDDAWIGPNVVFTNAPYPKGSRVKDELAGPTIRRGAKIGANSTILPGVIVGRGALIGAGSVVTRDVAENAIVAGNPARVKGSIVDLRYCNGERVYPMPDGSDGG